MRKIALVAGVIVGVVLGALTVVPVGAVETAPQPARVSSTHVLTDPDLCATMDVAFTLSANVAHPIIDVWGLSYVRDAAVSDLRVEAFPSRDCDGAGTVNDRLLVMDAYVLVAHPACANPYEAGPEEMDSDANEGVEVFSRCDGRAFAWRWRGAPARPMTSTQEGTVQVLGSSLPWITGNEWCLKVETATTFGLGGSESAGVSAWHAGGDVSYMGEACLPLR